MKKILFFFCPLVILAIFLLIFNIKNIDEKNADIIPVITFHRLVPENIKNSKYKDNVWVGSINTFENMMKYIYENDYKTLSSEELYDWITKKIELPKKSIMITFDDGFYEDYYLAYPILKKYNFKATSFIVGNRINITTPKYNESKIGYIGEDVINKVREEYPNFEFQSHSYNMHFYTKDRKHRIKSMTVQEMEADVISNEVYGFTTMAYPYGDFNINMERVLEEQGYLCAFRFGPSRYATRNSDRFAIPRIKINGFATINDMIKWVKY